MNGAIEPDSAMTTSSDPGRTCVNKQGIAALSGVASRPAF